MRIVNLTTLSSDYSLVLQNHSVSDTRIDAPGSVIGDGKTIDQLPPEYLMRDAVLLDLTGKEAKEPIDDEDLEAAEEGAGLAVRENEIVLLHIGRGRFARNNEFFSNHPYLSENGAEYLELRHVGGVGIDAPNLENPMSNGLPVHKALLRSGIFILENLNNLDILERERFRLIALPPKVKAGSALVRVLAVVDE
jgi:kynurenine formamidase